MGKTEKPKQSKKKPTLRQTKAAMLIKEILGKGGKMTDQSLGKILMQAGYSKHTADTPTNVTKSQGFNELMDQFIPEDALIRKHKTLLEAGKIENYTFPISTSDEDIKTIIESIDGCKLVRIQTSTSWKRGYFQTADSKIQLSALELAYKIRKKIGSTDPDEDKGGNVLEAVFIRIKTILPSAGQ